MFRRKRFGRLPILIGAGAAVAAGSWLLIGSMGGGDPQTAGAAPPANQVADSGARERDAGSARNATSTSALGAFGQPRGQRGGASEPLADRITAPDQQERQREIAQAGERLRTSGGNAPPINASNNDNNANNSQPTAVQNTGPDRTQPQPPAAPPTPPRTGAEANSAARQALARGLELLDVDPLQARRMLTAALDSRTLPLEDEENVRMALSHLGDRLVFGRVAHPQDSFARTHKVKSGESLTKIAKDLDLHVDWRFLLRVNGMQDARSLRAGQDLKVITGPFHAIIDKSEYRLDLYLGEGDERIFVRSFRVGLGEYDSTPPGMFRIGVKAENPTWVNPRDPREKYSADDPDNPIGDHWLALIGIDEGTRDFTGYGIHGTIEPESIGRQQSMGCVRLLPDDVKLIYEVLMTDVSTVEIRN